LSRPLSILFLTTLLLLILRIFLGIDFTDEPYVLAVAKSFSSGGRPFIDELFVHQTPVFYFYPLYLAFSHLSTDLTGVVLFFRGVYCVALLCAAGAFVYLNRARLSAGLLVFAVLPFLSFSPGWTYGLTYLTLPYLTMMMSAVFFWRYLDSPRRRELFFFGVFLGASAGCYPTLLVLPWIMLAVLARKTSLTTRLALVFLGGLVVGLFPLFCAVSISGVPAFLHMLDFDLQHRFQFLSHDKITGFLKDLGDLYFLWFLPPVLSFAARKFLKKENLFLFLNLFVATALVLLGLRARPFELQEHQFAVAVAMVLLPVWTFRKSTFLAYILVLGGICAYTSDAFGMLACASAAVVLIVFSLLAVARDPEFKSNPSLRRSFYALGTLITMGLQILRFACFYEPLHKISGTPVASGPYKYLFSEKRKIDFIDQFTADLREFGPSENLFIYYNLPSGYLLTSAKPFCPATWVERRRYGVPEVEVSLFDYYRKKNSFPSLLVEMKTFYGKDDKVENVQMEPDDILRKNLHAQKTYDQFLERPEYTIYRLR
jgi:hypothetical protein